MEAVAFSMVFFRSFIPLVGGEIILVDSDLHLKKIK